MTTLHLPKGWIRNFLVASKRNSANPQKNSEGRSRASEGVILDEDYELNSFVSIASFLFCVVRWNSEGAFLRKSNRKKIGYGFNKGHEPARVADSSSTNAVNFSSARTTKCFPSSRCAIQIVRPLKADHDRTGDHVW